MAVNDSDHRHSSSSPASAQQINPDAQEVAAGTVHETIEGWIPNLATDDELRIALEKAFDYRGDVTLTLKDGKKHDGYIYDRIAGPTLSASFVRILLKDSHQRVKAAYSDIAALAFTGRDTAAGKSWEAWTRKYWEKKSSGGTLNLHPESLD